MKLARSSICRAFTLLEVVLALALTVIVATLVGSAIYTATQAKNSINTSLDIARTNDVAIDLMAQEITNAIPPTQVAVTGTRVILPGQTASTGNLIGQFSTPGNTTNQTILDFFTTGSEPKADLQPDVREVQYALVDGPNGTKNLVRRVITNLLNSDLNPPVPADVVVQQKVVNVTFSFSDGVNVTPDWNSIQDATQTSPQSTSLPYMVTVTIESLPRVAGQANRINTRTIRLDCGTDTSLTSTTGGML